MTDGKEGRREGGKKELAGELMQEIAGVICLINNQLFQQLTQFPARCVGILSAP